VDTKFITDKFCTKPQGVHVTYVACNELPYCVRYYVGDI